MENPVISNHVDARHALDEPAGGCIVQADESPMLSASAVDNDGSMVGTNSSLYWASMLKLMEQGSGATPTSTLSSCSTNQNAYYAGGQVLSTIGQHGGTSHASSTSSSVHDQPMESVLSNHGVSDPDNAVWGQEFLSTGPIAESCKPSLDDHLAACADDGLHELLYPRTVLELLFSDQLKLEQLTSWPDNRSFALPQAAASVNNPANQLQLPADPQLSYMMKLPVHFPGSFPQFDDRLSSSTASSTLSDTTIDQWAAPPTNSTVGQCENMHGRSSSAIHLPASMQQHQQQQLPFDCTRVKVETPAATSPSNYYNSNLSTDINYHAGYNSKLSSPFLHSHNPGAAMVNHESMQIINEIDTKPALNNIANKLWPPPNGEHHAQLVTVSPRNHNYDQLVRSNQVGPHQNHGASSHDRFFNTHPVNQLGKKSRLEAIKRETIETMVHDTKISVNNIASGGIEEQKVPLSLENNFKRCRVDQASSAPLKSQPVRKEKLTERITTLQQLVSPFGKTDTASVLLEAIGYIKFLQEQVQALSSPYFKTGASQIGDKNSSGEEAKPDLKSRGLCLVPLSCTMQVANDNGADYWYGGAFR